MNETIKLLSDVIKSGVCGTPLTISSLSDEEAKKLYLLAKKQGLAHIVGDVLCRHALLTDQKTKSAFEKEAFATVCHYELMKKDIQFLCALFDEVKIPYLPLKGTVLREYYPSPWMRNSCDIDILVKPEDHARAKAVLLEKGYRFCVENAINAAFDSPSGIHFELHYRLVKETVLPLAAKTINNAWLYAEPVAENSLCYKMSDPVFYLYHIAHMAKHYLQGGCGMRPFLDLWILNHCVEHDEAARKNLIAECNLAAFSAAAEALSEVWFGDGVQTKTTLDMERFVMEGGVYGTVKNNISIQQAKKGGKLRYALARIFIPYDTLKYTYPVLQKHKWLLPVCQIRRWFRLVFGGGIKRSMRKLSLNSSISADKKRDTNRHLKELGF